MTVLWYVNSKTHFLGLLVSKMGYFWDIYKTAERARVSTSEASTRARSLARNFGEGCSPSLAAAENPRGPARARSLAQISEFFRTLARNDVFSKIILTACWILFRLLNSNLRFSGRVRDPDYREKIKMSEISAFLDNRLKFDIIVFLRKIFTNLIILV